MPATFFGDDVTEITFHGDQIGEVTFHGDVVWTAGDDWTGAATLLENFEGYSSQADLESSWDFGVSPAAYELNTSGAINGSQDIIAAQDTAHAPNESIGTSWGETYSALVQPNHSNNSPGLSVQHQPNYGTRLDDCYWCRADFGNDELWVAERVGGSTTVLGTATLPALDASGVYRIQVEMNTSDQVRLELYDEGDDPSEVSPHADTGFLTPGTVHSSGHLMLNAGREGSGNTQFDTIRQH